MTPRTTKEFFDTLAQRFDAQAAEGVAAVYQFDLSGPQGGQFVVSIADGVCQVREGSHPDPQVTLALPGDDCIGILEGKKDPMQVAMSGRLHVSGDLTLAFQLKSLFPTVR
ncbi:MAG: SCP2 sterol-binding domain-containing protein [Nitrospirota bacterium]|nr:SCP2 sterol-binding domain-containing protein [Nitrospirota bacterium]MDE3224363.1 SCP2 sterol-binding domain-containing protein [Nitrospirota bacterium]MDE3243596.1 SCP2 sterol-binding domain-containing protein [Nitrospirota bacterium]